uniref:Uncharacterized protein n=1 Tax=Anopheles maculatus TaxID=74869 RepID=A0A182T5Q0_9DIPT
MPSSLVPAVSSERKKPHHPTKLLVKSYTVDGLAGTGVGGGGSAGTPNATTVRRQRHSIAGQMSYFKMLGTFSKKMATSTNSLFSTAVISGSSSAPNLRDMIPSTASPSGKGKLSHRLYSLFMGNVGIELPVYNMTPCTSRNIRTQGIAMRLRITIRYVSNSRFR